MCIAGCTPSGGSSSGSGSGKGSSAPVGTINASCPSQTPNISTTPGGGPKDLGCGSFDWKIWWDIPNAAGKAGWVIQELTITYNIEKGDGSKVVAKNQHYWEAWPVEKGKKITRFQDKNEPPPYDDGYWDHSNRAGTKGTISYVGKAKFYEGDLPPDFIQNNPDTLAHDLYSTTKKPDFWDGTGVDHNLTATWNCTGGKRESDVTARAGSKYIAGTK